MSDHTGAELSETLQRLRAIDGAITSVEPLAGGVSSDIIKVVCGDRAIVVKRALPKLKVASDWAAPIERNHFEVAWLQTAGRFLADAVPEILAHDPATGMFAMPFLDPAAYPVWKEQLRDGLVDLAVAAEVGRRTAAIQAASTLEPGTAARFATDHIFHAIRLEPYLEATALKHPQIAAQLVALSQDTLATKRALVHGDVSPKNILVGPRGPVFLDAECAWFGDPAFDLAFCLNHLLLKCLWNRSAAPGYLRSFDALRAAYLAGVSWESPEEVEARASRLLAGLFLARVDGKSPVEYVVRESDRELVRSTAVPFIARPARRLGDIRGAWAIRLGVESGQA